MRRKIMTAVVCAVMTMSVVPVYADDTQTAKAEQEVTTEVTTTAATTTTTTKETTKTSTSKKSNTKTSTKKSTKKKDSKDKKEETKQQEEENKVIPMPTQVISKSSSSAIESRISKKEATLSKLEAKKQKISKQIKLETKKQKMLNEFYKKYTSNSKAEVALYGKEVTPSIEVSNKDEAMRNDLYELADLLGDKTLKEAASKYVFGINHSDFETLLDKNDTFNLNQYLKHEKILSVKPMKAQIKQLNKKIKAVKKEISKESQTRYFNPNDVSALSHITVDDAKQMLSGTALYADAKAYVKSEEKYHVNAVFLMGIAAHESAWGTSRRAREDNNLTGYGVTSDSAKGINKSTKEEGLLTTAKTLHEKYLTPGGSYYAGTSAEAVNKHYCVGGEWAAAVVNDAYQLMNQL